MGILNRVNIQLAYWRVKGSYIPVAAMLLTTRSVDQVVAGDIVRFTFSDVFTSEFIEQPTVNTTKHYLDKQF